MNRALFALYIAAACALAADGPDSASGMFKSQSVTMNVKSAMAFRAPSFADKGESIIVAVSNAQLNPETIADYSDRRRVIEKRIKNAQTGIVYFEFKPDGGAYRGMSYYFGPGNGCGYCTGTVTANTSLAGGKLTAKLVDAEKDRSFDISLTVTILADDHGTPLPADGGDPGKVFLQYHTAMVKGDRTGLKATMSQDQQQYWSDIERQGKLGSWLYAVGEAHPTKSMQIVKGYVSGNKALLLFEGDSPTGKITGEALLIKERDVWRVDDEITEPARQ